VTASELTGLGLLANGNYLKLGLTSKTHNGFIIGGGVEHRISNNFSLRLQYDYTDQGDVSYPTTYLPTSLNTTPAYSETVSQNLRVHLIRVGFNYHF
jgi:opacity protein-like surface antigen